MGARWNRYHTLTPRELPPDRELFAQVPAGLIYDRTVPARAVRLWAALYLEVYDPRTRTAAGLVDMHRICAAAHICPSLGRRYCALLEAGGWILERRTIRRTGLAGLVHVRLNLARK